MPSSHCTIFHLLTGFDKSPTNARHRREIGARSREMRSEVIADASPTPGKYLHAKYLELSAIHNPAV